jgi:O-antigen ligase
MVVGSTVIVTTIQFPILGRNISGWAWVVPFITSVFVIIRKPSRVTFPILVWSPWICIVVFYFIDSDFSYLQRSIMLISSIIVGMAASTCAIRQPQLRDFLGVTKVLSFLLFLTVVIRSGFMFTGILPRSSGLSALSMTAVLLCSIFAVEYSINKGRGLLHWIIGAAIPAITAAGVTIPFTFASLNIKRRLIFLTVVAALGVTLFYTERVQRKMFYSGTGTLQDVRFSNPDFFTTGRARLWDLMIQEIREKPLWGHGANASEAFVLSVTWGVLTHPHNDWLRLLYDFGFFGATVFAFCLVAQVIHLLKGAKRAFGESRILLYAGASSFLPFVLLMFTDNIILYASFFGNLQFTIIGLVYAAQRTQEMDTWHYFHSLPATSRSNLPYTHNNCANQQDRYLGT